jgi:hypothetical protein
MNYVASFDSKVGLFPFHCAARCSLLHCSLLHFLYIDIEFQCQPGTNPFLCSLRVDMMRDLDLLRRAGPGHGDCGITLCSIERPRARLLRQGIP